MLDVFRKYVDRHHLLQRGRCHLLAVSGGSDSMALLYLAAALRKERELDLQVIHLHHGLRSVEADLDARFTARQSWKLNLPCLIVRRDVAKLMQQQNWSMEMAARFMRQAFYREQASAHGATAVLTGHTLNDQAETLLLRLCRGTGPRGLGGIRPAREIEGIQLQRPLLNFSREALQTWLRIHGLSWREDATNRCCDIKRNYIRHEILTRLEQHVNPSVISHSAAAVSRWSEEDDFMHSCTEKIMKQVIRDGVIELCSFSRQHPALQRRILLAWLHDQHVPPEAVHAVLIQRIQELTQTSHGSAAVSVTEQLQVRRVYDKLSLVPAPVDHSWQAQTLPVQGTLELVSLGLGVDVCLSQGVLPDDSSRPGFYPASASLSGKAVNGRPLKVRPRCPGDRMIPLGMSSSRKVQDILVDLKVPEHERSRIPLVCVDDEPVWIPGYTIAAPFALNAEGEPAIHIHMYLLSQG